MKKFVSILVCLLLCFGAVFAVEATHSGWLGVDLAWYPGANKNAALYTNGGFAGADMRNYGIEGRITPWYELSVKTPFGDNPLTQGNTLNFDVGLEVTPVSVMPRAKLSFSPIAFLVFSAGVDVGTGWDCGNLFVGGMSVWNKTITPQAEKDQYYYEKVGDYSKQQVNYNPSLPFQNMFFEPWFQATFQFDVAALMPESQKKWMHICLLASYQIKYTGLAGAAEDDIWKWQLTGDKVNGWNHYVSVLLGYQMPLVLQTVGLMFEYEQYFDKPAFHAMGGGLYDLSDAICAPTFKLSPCAILKFNEHHSLTVQLRFKTMSNYSLADMAIGGANMFGGYRSDIWYFDRIALSYCWTY